MIFRCIRNRWKKDDKRDNSIAEDDGKNAPPTPSRLYTLATQWAWPAVAERLESHPHEVTCYVNEYGETILHWALFGRSPIEVVTQMLALCPELAFIGNCRDHWPLHVALYHRASVDVMRLLIQSNPESAGKITVGGETPLLVVATLTPTFTRQYRYRCDCLRTILSTPAGLASMNFCNRSANISALEILVRRVPRPRRLRIEDQMCVLESMLDNLRIRGDDWFDCATILLWCEYQTTMQQRGAVDMVHLSDADLDRPHAGVLQAVLVMSGVHHYLRDVMDMTVARHLSLLSGPLLLPDDAADGRQQWALHVAASSASASALEMVLAAHPAAAQAQDARGKFPLELAVQARHRRRRQQQRRRQRRRRRHATKWDSAVRALTRVYPEAMAKVLHCSISAPLLPHALYCLYAAREYQRFIDYDGSRNTATTIVFRVLKARPEILLQGNVGL